MDPTDGVVLGLPGSTTGWGFTITNTSDYMVLSAVEFWTPTANDDFTDFAAQFQFLVIGPAPESTSITQAFDEILLEGLGSFTIDIGTPLGAMIEGEIHVYYDLFSRSPNDPDFNPDTDTINPTGRLLSAPARVDAIFPEPTAVGLLGIGALAMLNRRAARR